MHKNVEQFWQILKSDAGYRSPVRPAPFVKRFAGLATPVFNTHMVRRWIAEGFLASLGGYNNEKWALASVKIIKAVESVGGQLMVSGLKDIYNYRGPLVYIGNHMSLLETMILPSILLAANKITFVVKDELLRYPVVGILMRALNPIAVSRSNPRQDLKVVLQEGQKFLDSGCSVVIFPQATRSTAFETQTFNSLGVKLAGRSKVPVVPIAIKTDFQETGKWFKDVGPVDPDKTLCFKFGEPLPVEGKGRETHRKVVDFISSSLSEWGVEIR